MAIQQNIPGDVTIGTISLFVDRGVVNLTEHVQILSIFESIFTPGVVAQLTVKDTMNLSSLLPILGGERMLIELNTPGRKTLKYEFVLTAFKEGTPADNMRSKAYTLIAVTRETLVDKTCQVSKAYNTNVSNMISDIVKSYLKTNKKIEVQQTRGIQKVIVPSLRPFDAITMLRKRSTAIDDKSSSYVFFENQQGFHFKTLEKLMSQTSVGDRIFVNDESLNTDITRSQFRNIVNYDQPQQFEVIDRLDSGGLAQEVQKFDYKTLTYTKNIHRYKPSDFKNADGSMIDPDSRELKQSFGRGAGSSIWVDHDSGNPDTFLSEGLGPRASGTSIYSQGSLLLSVFGDSELTAGQLIEVRMVENSTATQAPEEHKQLSGKYVIAFLHHIIMPSSSNPRYTCSIEAIKGGYKEIAK